MCFIPSRKRIGEKYNNFVERAPTRNNSFNTQYSVHKVRKKQKKVINKSDKSIMWPFNLHFHVYKTKLQLFIT